MTTRLLYAWLLPCAAASAAREYLRALQASDESIRTLKNPEKTAHGDAVRRLRRGTVRAVAVQYDRGARLPAPPVGCPLGLL